MKQLGARYVTRQRKAGEIGFQRVGGVDHHFSGKRRCVLAEQRTGGVVWGGEDNGIGPRDRFFDRLRWVGVGSFGIAHTIDDLVLPKRLAKGLAHIACTYHSNSHDLAPLNPTLSRISDETRPLMNLSRQPHQARA